MKKVFLSICLTTATIIAAFSQTTSVTKPNPNAPEIKFESTTYDFGTIPEGPEAVANYNFMNTGKTPLLLSDVVKSCGCTNVEWPKEPIFPGKSGVIKATYSTQNRVGTFTKSITVKSNATQSDLVLTFTGTVKAAAPTTQPDKANNQINVPEKH